MRKLALVLALVGGLAACSKNKAAPAAPSNTAPEPAPSETDASPGGAPAEDEVLEGGGGEPPPMSDPCAGGE